jgi:hypothetical protein
MTRRRRRRSRSRRLVAAKGRIRVIRVLIGGVAGLALTYGIGHLFGTALS